VIHLPLYRSISRIRRGFATNRKPNEPIRRWHYSRGLPEHHAVGQGTLQRKTTHRAGISSNQRTARGKPSQPSRAKAIPASVTISSAACRAEIFFVRNQTDQSG
jgi:hypothetical protein